jgi:hypothetical protein
MRAATPFDQTVSIQCGASDPSPGSGLASDTCADVSAPAYTFSLGSHTLSASAEDVAGNVGSGSTTFTVAVTFASLKVLVARFSTNPDVTEGLNDKLKAAAKAKTAAEQANHLRAFANQVHAQTGKALTRSRPRSCSSSLRRSRSTRGRRSGAGAARTASAASRFSPLG